MSEWLLLFGVAIWLAGLWVGGAVEREMAERHWNRHHYCPTCDRLDCAREHS